HDWNPMRNRLAALAFLGFLGIAGNSPGLAQDAAAVIGPPPPAPYEAEMLRLAEFLGGVHYLRPLCNHPEEKTVWRDEMQALLEAENPDDAWRQRLVDRFNRGYEGFRSVYRTCTPAANVAGDRYLQEGVKLASEIAGRYGSTQ